MGIFNRKKSILDSVVNFKPTAPKEEKIPFAGFASKLTNSIVKNPATEKKTDTTVVSIVATPIEVVEPVPSVVSIEPLVHVPVEMADGGAQTPVHVEVETENKAPEPVKEVQSPVRIPITSENPNVVSMSAERVSKVQDNHAPLTIVSDEHSEFLPKLTPKHVNVTYLKEFPDPVILRPDQYFSLVTYKKLATVHDLHKALSTMTKEEWDMHVDHTRNDFADWIGHEFGNLPLSTEAWKCNSPEELRELLSKQG